jgi:dipeptidyl aminopeptidase/acylaminoacyl peptidase
VLAEKNIIVRNLWQISCLILICGCFSGWSDAAESKRKVAFGDLKTFPQVQSMELSPDGEALAYSVGWEKPKLWLLDTRRGSSPHLVGEGQFPRWAPDGMSFAYYSRNSGTLQLWLYQVASAKSFQLTYLEGGIDPDTMTLFIGMDGWLGDPLRYSWSPDSEHLVFPSRVTLPFPSIHRSALTASRPPDWSPLVLTNTTPAQWTLAGIFRSGGFDLGRKFTNGKIDEQATSRTEPQTADQLFVVTVSTKKIRQLTTDAAGYFTPEWSPDGKEILCVSNEGRPLLGWGSGPTNLYTIDVMTGVKTAITSDAVYKRVPSWSPDGKSVAYLGAEGNNPGSVFLFVRARKNGTPKNLTVALDRRVREAHWLSDSLSIAINYWDGVDSPIASLTVANEALHLLTEGEIASRGSFSVSRTGVVAWNQSDGSRPSSIHVRFGNGRKVVMDLQDQTGNLLLGAQEVLRWRNGAGQEREGVLIKPPDFRQDKKYPVIVDAYPQLQNGFKASPMAPGQAWAARGYIVFYPDADGPHVWMNPWKSMARGVEARGPRGIDAAVDDVLSGVDELVRLGIADPQRMCIYGFSNGGGIVNQIVTKTDRFKCAISVAAAVSADWTMPFFLYTDSKAISQVAGATPWESPQIYQELSAIYRLDKIKTPMLLASGDDDGGGLLGEIEMYNGLRQLGRPVTLLRYPKQGHGFEGFAMEDFWERENRFIDSYLGKPEPGGP